jgi:hypothetical protein
MSAASRTEFDRIVGLESSDLNDDEIDTYRAGVYRKLAAEALEARYIKTHDAYLVDSAGRPQIPADATQSAVYIVRNPLDVAVSFSHHLGRSLDITIEHMADGDFAFGRSTDRLHRQLRQKMLSWSGHVESWLGHSAFPVHLMRYEDMLERPHDTFTDCVRFLGLEYDLSRVHAALEQSSFEKLRGQEQRHGFRERPGSAAVFFRSGSSGQWRNKLNIEQIARIGEQHGRMMRNLGYSETYKRQPNPDDCS